MINTSKTTARTYKVPCVTLAQARERLTLSSVVLYARESTAGQAPHLKPQIRLLRKKAHSSGAKVSKVFSEITSGHSLSHEDRTQLYDALAYAKKKRQPILIESPDRLFRPESYSPRNQHDNLTYHEHAQLCEAISDVEIIFLRDGRQARSGQTIRGMSHSPKRIGRPIRPANFRYQRGRPSNPKRGELDMNQITQNQTKWMLQLGCSISSISRALHVSRQTIMKWRRKFEKINISFPKLKRGRKQLSLLINQ
jgi:DNA invertase Pin-like site-specific DNA recombinase